MKENQIHPAIHPLFHPLSYPGISSGCRDELAGHCPQVSQDALSLLLHFSLSHEQQHKLLKTLHVMWHNIVWALHPFQAKIYGFRYRGTNSHLICFYFYCKDHRVGCRSWLVDPHRIKTNHWKWTPSGPLLHINCAHKSCGSVHMKQV